jgi:hypothetical protein
MAAVDEFYDEGKRAYRAGVACWENPYAYGSYAAASWEAGYESELAECY